ncbi:MAG: hypothetical protein GC134_02415 [Proteobacteria bacterium]|nr:hypothetical protein [Pseudomonadota bacterium]
MDFKNLVAQLLRLRDRLDRIIGQLMDYLWLDRPYTMGYHPHVETLIDAHGRTQQELRMLEQKLGLAPNQLPDDATLYYARKLMAEA